MGRSRRLGSAGEVSAPAEENRELRLFLGKNVLEPILESKVVTKRRVLFWTIFEETRISEYILDNEFIDLERCFYLERWYTIHFSPRFARTEKGCTHICIQ